MAIRTTTQPLKEPVSLAEVKRHLRITLKDDDIYLTGLIRRARALCETYSGLRFIDQTVTFTLSSFYSRLIPLPVHPVSSITAVKYFDATPTQITMPTANYKLVKSAKPYHIAPAFNTVWPSLQGDYDDVEITMVVGFGADATDVPGDIIEAILLMCGHFYENRQNEVAGTIVSKLNIGAIEMLNPHVLYQ